MFFKVAITKIITLEKISKSQNFAIFPPLEDTVRNLIWTRRELIFEIYNRVKYNYFLDAIFFYLRFCSISQMPLISLLSSPVAFFTSTILPLLAALLHSQLKGKSQRFLRFLVRYKVHFSSFSYWAKSRWLATLSLIVTVTSHGTSSPPWTRPTYNNCL